MKKKVLVASALAAVLGLASLTPLAVRPASADTTSGEKRYYDYVGPSLCEITTEEVTFTDRTETYTTTSYNVPYYIMVGSELTNACGAVAGSIVVGFYDRYYENLIPNYTAYYPNNRYKPADGTYVYGVMESLYTLMRTNVDDVGVSEYDCRDGLQAYVENKGLSLSYSSIKSGGSFSYSLYKQAINANKPVLLFCTELPISLIGTTTGYDAVSTDTIEGCHIVVGFGYYTVNYYNGSSIYRTDNYLLIATGLHSNVAYYVNINSTSWLDSGYSVTIS